MTVSRLRPHADTIFAQVSALALTHGAINLGQGFPDTDGPEGMLEAAAQAMREGHNQYPPGAGVPELRHAVVDQVARSTGVHYDAETEVLITVGATEGIAAAVLGLVEPGDEVVVIEPFYDSYPATVALAGATVRSACLVRDAGSFRLDIESLRSAFTPATRAVLVNTPHNPTGAVLPKEDLEAVAELCHQFDALAISDEVYEHLVFDGYEHVSIASLPGMRDRTVRVSGASKTFACTGWKIGWITGPAHLVAGARAAKQYLSYSSGTPLQLGVAHALRHEQPWIGTSRRTLQQRRDQLARILGDIGFTIADTAGTYFITADPRPLGVGNSTQWSMDLPRQIGVAVVPFTPFVSTYRQQWNHLVRFAFCKRPEVLDEAGRRLTQLRSLA